MARLREETEALQNQITEKEELYQQRLQRRRPGRQFVADLLEEITELRESLTEKVNGLYWMLKKSI